MILQYSPRTAISQETFQSKEASLRSRESRFALAPPYGVQGQDPVSRSLVQASERSSMTEAHHTNIQKLGYLTSTGNSPTIYTPSNYHPDWVGWSGPTPSQTGTAPVHQTITFPLYTTQSPSTPSEAAYLNYQTPHPTPAFLP